MFKNKLFLQNINFKEPNPLINFKEWALKVVTEPITFNENKTTVISNVCLVLSEFKDKCFKNDESSDNACDQMDIDSKTNEKKKFLIPLSCNSLQQTSIESLVRVWNNLEYINTNQSKACQIEFLDILINRNISVNDSTDFFLKVFNSTSFKSNNNNNNNNNKNNNNSNIYEINAILKF
ncbi:beta-ketoacyl synthase family protein [Dictyostelium discoideum AX4]|uniref:Beta-ketoacyl synthase family protein n=1 Tax=Dictyostelium discoideum TaxID=44689 RepID=B0G171_DICDI|nr:beta-ketoacyl synthase family protein [Dictyostelium discoideum AX4]EDR41038.1 beta-ketoacyl synthase family protein [Dictyostelium discoideum AX4]|eukprot:XP_001733034.1 beta-ketoacyl synthase family protein [Dictyostelium discoideum AX4]